MKKTILLIFLFVGLFYVKAQDKDWSIEVGYPVSVGEDFGGSSQGVIGAGLRYRFTTVGKMRVGVSLDVAWFSTKATNDTDPIQEFDFRDFFLQPRLFVELPITTNNKLKLTGGLGWSWNQATIESFFEPEGRVKVDFWNDGPNFNLGLIYDISTRWFVQAQYDLIFASGDLSSSEIGLIKVGAGFRF